MSKALNEKIACLEARGIVVDMRELLLILSSRFNNGTM